jgi:tetratricopeptide (TPR) repeat protein
VGHYREVLKVEPDNVELHAKLAPLLVEHGDERAAWDSYIFAGRAYLKDGYPQKALSLFRQAATHFSSVRVWEQIADIHQQRGHQQDAANALLEGSKQFTSSKVVEHGLRLITRAFRLQPYRTDISLQYASLLATSGRFPQARRLLNELSERVKDDRRARIRIAWLRFRLFPGMTTFSDYLRARI